MTETVKGIILDSQERRTGSPDDAMTELGIREAAIVTRNESERGDTAAGSRY
jgi:hypothetical protein